MYRDHRSNFLYATGVLCLQTLLVLNNAGAMDPQRLYAAWGDDLLVKTGNTVTPFRERVQMKRSKESAGRLLQEQHTQPVWVTPDGLREKAKTLREVLAAADTQGLNPADYYPEELKRYWQNKDAESLSRLESLLTLALRRYLNDLTLGRRNPRDVDPEYFAYARSNDVKTDLILQRALASEDLKTFLEQQAPPFEQYQQLREKLAEYRRLAAAGGWPQLPKGPSLKPGMQDARVPLLRTRLRISGDLPGGVTSDGSVYDQNLVAAVIRFQGRHGQTQDGVVGVETLTDLNVPVENRIRQIILSLESWRWVAREPGDWFLMVNIPSYELTAVRDGNPELKMPVIVGKDITQTPLFNAHLSRVEFNPYWNVPLSISSKEMLPKLREDPNILAEDNIRLFEVTEDGRNEIDAGQVDWRRVSAGEMHRFHMRQDPGPGNSLGRIKFSMPNQFDVYMHDTPSRSLFQRPMRAYSHGCVRVSRPQELAAYVLGGAANGWTEERVGKLVAAEEHKTSGLAEPLPIYITYRTAAVNSENHQVYFYRDVYKFNPLLEKTLL